MGAAPGVLRPLDNDTISQVNEGSNQPEKSPFYEVAELVRAARSFRDNDEKSNGKGSDFLSPKKGNGHKERKNGRDTECLSPKRYVLRLYRVARSSTENFANR